MAKRLRQHVNPLKMSALVVQGGITLPQERVVEVELGCADALFLIRRAAANPERHFVGVDIRQEFLNQGLIDIAERRLKNIELVQRNLIVDMAELFPAGSIQAFFVNFPDPWFKGRTKNRRWFTRPALDAMVESLAPTGQILYQTDVWDLAIEALGLLESHPGLVNMNGEWRFLNAHTFNAVSLREEMCVADGKKIWRMLFRRRD